MVLCYLDGLQLDFAKSLAELTQEQRVFFEEFQNKVWPNTLRTAGENANVDRFTLLRFLRADKFNTNKAATRLLACIRWRATNGIDEAVNQPPKNWEKYRLLRIRRICGYDYEGRVVMFERLGEFFGSDNSKALELHDWLMCYAYDCIELEQQLRESSQQRKKPVTTITFVGDLACLRLRQSLANLGLLQKFTEVVEVHFPEFAGPIILMNAPTFVYILWNAAKRFLDPSVVAKIVIHNGVPEKDLLALMPSDVLLKEYGGTSNADYPHVTPAAELGINISNANDGNDAILGTEKRHAEALTCRLVGPAPLRRVGTSTSRQFGALMQRHADPSIRRVTPAA
eukprot:gnl/MRDRNA2_/MRDRNA2_61241_c0_seq1.p1 gnl/MRDRNA2_/MRDRNA2_61241_c0~~gnl/MRDRNA2_/MRDRNA2_61241_c0_seq1.p1  ORF type:complete len:341 (-),score=50.64 gnl/MRDRNA2_/MRDRNA2_61241_c0_seq1:16-1038(-)